MASRIASVERVRENRGPSPGAALISGRFNLSFPSGYIPELLSRACSLAAVRVEILTAQFLAPEAMWR